MVKKPPPAEPPGGDLTYRALVERVVAGDEAAWREFVERFSRLVFSLVWRYADGDQDQCADLYLYVIEGLRRPSEGGESFYRLRRYLESIERFGGQGKLTTWLGRVTQNLVSDHFRELEGRRTIPRPIQRMDLLTQRLFKLMYWDNLPEREVRAVLDTETGGLAPARFDRMLAAINRALKDVNRWSLYSEVLRRAPALPLHPVGESEEGAVCVQVADPHPAADPERGLETSRSSERARALGKALRAALRELGDQERLMLLGRFKHGLTAQEIARMLGRKDEKRIYVEIDRLRDGLRRSLEAAGFRWDEVAGGVHVLDGMLDEVA
ncbi:MAG TPA: sigma-70 family RNA polymerase sigma factor [Myxococcota bacterium]|nr:sigma-70 family RNA polymerase sigma factor [Myxococcota bacterium]HRY95778.1 sigma-70 family RNA polymerase sigma factor [Myxococcota bacterium]